MILQLVRLTFDVTAGNGRDIVYSIFKRDILVTLKLND